MNFFRHKFFLFLFLCGYIICCSAQPTILVVGDSLSAAYGIPPEDGWVNLLALKLQNSFPKARVINSSIVGDTTANGLKRLPALLDEHQPQIVILELGGNDGIRGLPLTTTSNNLEKMITLSLEKKAQVLLIGMKLPPNYGSYAQGFEQIYKSLSQNYPIAFIPFLLENVALKSELMQRDRIHPKAQAQSLILENVWGELIKLLKNIS